MRTERPTIDELIDLENKNLEIKESQREKWLESGYIACPYCGEIHMESKQEIAGAKDRMYNSYPDDYDTIEIEMYCENCEKEFVIDFNYEVRAIYDFSLSVKELAFERMDYDEKFNKNTNEFKNENQLNIFGVDV